jgi:hypothetical protein
MKINLAPILFSEAEITIGLLENRNTDEYASLRSEHEGTHAFRFDSRLGATHQRVIRRRRTPG